MGRPLLGKAKRTEIISVRITEDERRELEKVYPTAAIGLHALMKAWMVNRK